MKYLAIISLVFLLFGCGGNVGQTARVIEKETDKKERQKMVGKTITGVDREGTSIVFWFSDGSRVHFKAVWDEIKVEVTE